MNKLRSLSRLNYNICGVIMDESHVERTKALLGSGAEIVGSAVGGVVGYLTAGLGGAVAGAVAGPFLGMGLELVADFAIRDLSRRERIKAGAGLAYAYSNIILYLEEGRKPREDGFFDLDETSRSISHEILEGVLIKCKNEHEEKKLRLIGNIYANTAFMPHVSTAGANWLIQQSQDWTYRQLCMLALIQQKENKEVSWGPNDRDPAFEMEYKQIDYLIARDRNPMSVEIYQKTGEGLSIIGLSRTGRFCYEVMGLQDILEEDLRYLQAHFPRAFA
jgi:hypothetical protein